MADLAQSATVETPVPNDNEVLDTADAPDDAATADNTNKEDKGDNTNDAATAEDEKAENASDTTDDKPQTDASGADATETTTTNDDANTADAVANQDETSKNDNTGNIDNNNGNNNDTNENDKENNKDENGNKDNESNTNDKEKEKVKEKDKDSNDDDEDNNELIANRGLPRDETEMEKEKKQNFDDEKAAAAQATTDAAAVLGNGWSIKQASKKSKVKGLRGEPLHLHTITVNFIISRMVDGKLEDFKHNFVFKHYEKRSGSRILKTSKEVKLDDRIVYDRKKDKPSNIPYIEVFLENRQPEKISVMITPTVNEKKKKISYAYEVQINGIGIEEAYKLWLKQKENGGKGGGTDKKSKKKKNTKNASKKKKTDSKKKKTAKKK